MRCRSERTTVFTIMALLGLTAIGPIRAEEDWLARSRAILEAVNRQSRPTWLEANPATEEARRQAQEMLQSSPRAIPFPQSPSLPDGTEASGRQIVLYVSTSLGEAALDEIFDEAAGRRDVLVVFRGMKPGQKLPDFVRELHRSLQRFDASQLPQVLIDPNRFRSAGVSAVPTLTVEENGQVLARVRGLTGIAWFRSRTDRQIAKEGSEPQDLGARGPTREITEVDLIEEMQRRIAGIDWAARKREAFARFWTSRTFYELPEATTDRERRIDPAVIAPWDVTAPDGTVIVRAGQRVNPLDKLPFRQRLIVFDATRPNQVVRAKQLGQEASERRVVYIATCLDRNQGWEGLTRLETELGAPVYLLTPDLRDRFQLEFVPAVLEAEDRWLLVREFRTGGAL
jgi:conjugal transfer pilus assembly protein TraW